MTATKKETLVKVKAIYDRLESPINLWGVQFLLVGKGDDAALVAEVPAEVAKSLLDAKRAVKA